MNREELERLARDVAENALHRARIVFQVKHPHYTPPPGAGVGNDEDLAHKGVSYYLVSTWVLAIAHGRAKRLYDTEGQFYSRGSVWTSMGIDMQTLLETLGA
jgi:hypothetical protein